MFVAMNVCELNTCSYFNCVGELGRPYLHFYKRIFLYEAWYRLRVCSLEIDSIPIPSKIYAMFPTKIFCLIQSAIIIIIIIIIYIHRTL